MIGSDSRSITVGLMPSNEDEQVKVRIQCVPGHTRLQGNAGGWRDEGDDNKGYRVKGDERIGVSFSSTKATIHRKIRNPPIAHTRTRSVDIVPGVARGSSFTRRLTR